MTLTRFERIILRDAKYLDKLGVDYFLNGSTLLGAFREKRALEWDKEVNFGMLAEDKTAGLVEQIRKDYKWLQQQSGSTYTFFGQDWKKDYETFWDIESGFTLISSYSRYKDTRYQVMTNGTAIVYPSFHFDDKTKWETVEFLGRTFKTPYKPVKWLEFYYGSDWTQPKRDWLCHLDAKNLVPYENIRDLDHIKWTYHYNFTNFIDN